MSSAPPTDNVFILFLFLGYREEKREREKDVREEERSKRERERGSKKVLSDSLKEGRRKRKD